MVVVDILTNEAGIAPRLILLPLLCSFPGLIRCAVDKKVLTRSGGVLVMVSKWSWSVSLNRSLRNPFSAGGGGRNVPWSFTVLIWIASLGCSLSRFSRSEDADTWRSKNWGNFCPMMILPTLAPDLWLKSLLLWLGVIMMGKSEAMTPDCGVKTVESREDGGWAMVCRRELEPNFC